MPIVGPARQARANRRIQRMWRRGLSERFGVATPQASRAPTFTVEGERLGQASYNPDGTRTLSLSPSAMRMLSVRGKGPVPQTRRQTAKDVVLHELAHLYQDRSVVPTVADQEGLAENFAQRTFKELGIRKGNRRPPIAVYRPERIAARKKYGKEFWRKAQFGSNWGKNPADIRWKTSAPPDPYREG